MSDMPKNLQRAARFRWWALSAAALLTVVAGALAWVEVTTEGAPSAPRAFVSTFATVVWIGFFSLCSTVYALQRMAVREARIEKRAERNTERILQAIKTKRLSDLADLLEPEGSARPINERG